jgi:hypothetical protein
MSPDAVPGFCGAQPAYDHSLCHQQLKRKRTDSKSHLANDNDLLIEKQIP